MNLTSKGTFPKPVIPHLPAINIINKQYEDVNEQWVSQLSLASIAKNGKKGKHTYLDKVSKVQNDVGVLSQPVVSTGI